MWINHEYQLCKYGIAICKEWINRGYKDSMLVRFEKILSELTDDCCIYDKNTLCKQNFKKWKPKWMKDDKLFRSHRAALLFKNYDHYKQFGWAEKPKIEYYWGD